MFDPSLMVSQTNPGERFAQAFQQGMQVREQNMAKAAMAALVRDPNNQKALEALAQVDPNAAAQFQQRQAEQHQAMLAQHAESIQRGAQIIRQMQPKDQASWDQARTVAAQAGIDISQVPAQFDPAYVQGLVSIADTFSPQKQDQGRIVTPQPGGGAGVLGPDGTFHWVVQPNDGSHPSGASTVPQVHDQASYDAIPPGGQYMTPDGHVRVKQGGQAPQAPGGFL